MVSPRGLKPKKHQEEKGQAHKLMRKEEKRKRKEVHVRGLKKKAKLGSSETTKRFGIPQACKYSQEKITTVQKKKTKRNTRNRREGHVPFKCQVTQQEKKEKNSATSHSASG